MSSTSFFTPKKLRKATDQSGHEKEFAKLAFVLATRRIIDQPPLIFHTDDIRDEEIEPHGTRFKRLSCFTPT